MVEIHIKHPLKYMTNQLNHIKCHAIMHSQLEAQKDLATLWIFLERFFLEWELLYPENLTGLDLEAMLWERQRDLIKMLRWAYWGMYLPHQKRMAAQQQKAHARTEAEATRKCKLRLEREEADKIYVNALNKVLSERAHTKYMEENPGHTRVRGGQHMAGPFSQGYEEMLAAEEPQSSTSDSSISDSSM